MFDEFLRDSKADKDPIVNLKAAINELEQGRIDPELLEIRVKLAKAEVSAIVNSVSITF